MVLPKVNCMCAAERVPEPLNEVSIVAIALVDDGLPAPASVQHLLAPCAMSCACAWLASSFAPENFLQSDRSPAWPWQQGDYAVPYSSCVTDTPHAAHVVHTNAHIQKQICHRDPLVRTMQVQYAPRQCMTARVTKGRPVKTHMDD